MNARSEKDPLLSNVVLSRAGPEQNRGAPAAFHGVGSKKLLGFENAFTTISLQFLGTAHGLRRPKTILSQVLSLLPLFLQFPVLH